ncbi:hypothetical protein BH23GEM9_BH23GEM9_10100 [soil metagenome]
MSALVPVSGGIASILKYELSATALSAAFLGVLTRPLYRRRRTDRDEDGNEPTAPDLRQPMLAAALEASRDPVFIMDAHGVLLYGNSAYLRLETHGEGEPTGRPVSLLPYWRAPASVEEMWQTLHAGASYRGELSDCRPDSDVRVLEALVSPLDEGPGQPRRYVAVCRDVATRTQHDREREDRVLFDELTGLPLPRLLEERARQVLALARRHGSLVALLHVELEATAGQRNGDEVVKAVAECLRQGLRESDALARRGADEFLVVLSEVADEQSVASVARRLHEAICGALPARDGSDPPTFGARLGVALYPKDAACYDELVVCAATATDRAFRSGTGFEFFEHGLSEATRERLSLEDDLHWAWEEDQFILHYQPILDSDGQIAGAEALARGDVAGVEALARWPHSKRGMVAPSQFIPLAERTGRILSLDRWALATSARQAALWSQSGWNGWISVNLSARSLRDPELPAFVARTIAANGLGAARLMVEITESTAMRDPALTASVLHGLRAAGVGIAVDDFGVGHSSLAYLKLFPVDVLKVDACFVRELGTGSRDEQLVEFMILLAHRIGAKVVAEGVEEECQMEWLKRAGCDFIQGYLVGRPAAPGSVPAR